MPNRFVHPKPSLNLVRNLAQIEIKEPFVHKSQASAKTDFEQGSPQKLTLNWVLKAPATRAAFKAEVGQGRCSPAA